MRSCFEWKVAKKQVAVIFVFYQIPLLESNGIDKVHRICLHIKLYIPNYRNIELLGSRPGKKYFESYVAMPIYLLVYIKATC